MQKQKRLFSNDRLAVFVTTVILMLLAFFQWGSYPVHATTPPIEGSIGWWEVQAVDTMKFSRDRSREYRNSPELRKVADEHIGRIAAMGATHVSLGTPYDEEFLPVLKTWVESARAHNVKVWFRGNWSGWEEWFDYPPITRQQHLERSVAFVKNNPDLFQDGDIFQACPECENGGPGDPRETGDVASYRQFLIDEHEALMAAFAEIDVAVDTRYNSMNGDVARLIMDRETTKALGGLIVVDHYVETPEQLVADIEQYAEESGGKVVLGEFGAPIPDIHGRMSEAEQAKWLQILLDDLIDSSVLVGMNYWTDTGSSTEIWTGSGRALSAVETIRTYFQPKYVHNSVVDQRKRPIPDVTIRSQQRTVMTDSGGTFTIPYTHTQGNVVISKVGYSDRVLTMNEFIALSEPVILEYDLFSKASLTSLLASLYDRLLQFFLFTL